MKKFILIVIFLLFASTAVAKEIWILHETLTGYIVSSGRIDREWDSKNRDGSTISEWIERQLNEGFVVVYLPNQKLPKPKKHKIVDGEIVDLTPEDKAVIKGRPHLQP
ncbi:unnamed protein product, partial [marine sediment metagenome]